MNAALSWINSWWGSWRLSLMIVSLLVIISSPLISMTSVVEFWGQALTGCRFLLKNHSYTGGENCIRLEAPWDGKFQILI